MAKKCIWFIDSFEVGKLTKNENVIKQKCLWEMQMGSFTCDTNERWPWTKWRKNKLVIVSFVYFVSHLFNLITTTELETTQQNKHSHFMMSTLCWIHMKYHQSIETTTWKWWRINRLQTKNIDKKKINENNSASNESQFQPATCETQMHNANNQNRSCSWFGCRRWNNLNYSNHLMSSKLRKKKTNARNRNQANSVSAWGKTYW